ncbi:hypothetical protein Tco_1527245, partial [Tanacetum coccineum]
MEIGAPEARHRLPMSSKDLNKTDLLHLGPGRGRRVVCSVGWEEKNEVSIKSINISSMDGIRMIFAMVNCTSFHATA